MVTFHSPATRAIFHSALGLTHKGVGGGDGGGGSGGGGGGGETCR